MTVGFKRIKWFTSRSAYQDMQYFRQRRAAAIRKNQDMMDGINTAMQNANQNKITGLSTLAAQAALKRIQDMGKAKSAEITKKIDSAQQLVDTARSSSLTSAGGTSTMLDTVA